MNNVVLVGRLTRDPEISANGDLTIARMTVACDRPGKKEEGKQSADFVPCVAFGKTAEAIDKYSYKGQRVSVNGSVSTGSYEKDGVKKYTFNINVNRVEFLEWQNEENRTAAEPEPSAMPDGFAALDEDDMPF